MTHHHRQIGGGGLKCQNHPGNHSVNLYCSAVLIPLQQGVSFFQLEKRLHLDEPGLRSTVVASFLRRSEKEALEAVNNPGGTGESRRRRRKRWRRRRLERVLAVGANIATLDLEMRMGF